MSLYYQEFWIGYLSSVMIQKCIKLARERCPGCAKKFKSALLHLHEQLSLEQKLDCYFEEVRGLLVSKIGFYFADFEKKMVEPYGDDFKKLYIDYGKSFLFLANARTIYFGRYIDESNCELIHSKSFLQKDADTSETPSTSTAIIPEVIAIQNYPKKRKSEQGKYDEKQSKVSRKKQQKITQHVPSTVKVGEYKPSSPQYAPSHSNTLLEELDDLSDFE